MYGPSLLFSQASCSFCFPVENGAQRRCKADRDGQKRRTGGASTRGIIKAAASLAAKSHALAKRCAGRRQSGTSRTTFLASAQALRRLTSDDVAARRKSYSPSSASLATCRALKTSSSMFLARMGAFQPVRRRRWPLFQGGVPGCELRREHALIPHSPHRSSRRERSVWG